MHTPAEYFVLHAPIRASCVTRGPGAYAKRAPQGQTQHYSVVEPAPSGQNQTTGGNP